MGDWIRTDLGFVNFDQILVFDFVPPVPQPQRKDRSVLGSQRAPSDAAGSTYTLRASFSDGQTRDIYSEMTWEQAWAMQNAWHAMLDKQGKGGAGSWVAAAAITIS